MFSELWFACCHKIDLHFEPQKHMNKHFCQPFFSGIHLHWACITSMIYNKCAKSIFYLNAKVEDINPNGFTGCRGWLTDFRMNNKQIALNDLLSAIIVSELV